MPRTSPERPRLLSSSRPGDRIIAVLVLAGVAYFGVHWWQSRGPSGPDRPGMAPATVLKTDPAKAGELDLTVRYTVDGKPHQVTKTVDAAAFRAQGEVAWVCYKPGDAGDAAIRLPQDPLCGQR